MKIYATMFHGNTMKVWLVVGRIRIRLLSGWPARVVSWFLN